MYLNGKQGEPASELHFLQSLWRSIITKEIVEEAIMAIFKHQNKDEYFTSGEKGALSIKKEKSSLKKLYITLKMSINSLTKVHFEISVYYTIKYATAC